MTGGFFDETKRPSRLMLQAKRLKYASELQQFDGRMEEVAGRLRTVEAQIEQLRAQSIKADANHEHAKYAMLMLLLLTLLLFIIVVYYYRMQFQRLTDARREKSNSIRTMDQRKREKVLQLL